MKIKVLTYNTCFGLKSDTIWDSYNATWRIVHKRKNPKEIKEKSNFQEVYQLIKDKNPEIIILNEVFDDLQTKPVIKELKRLGYNYTSTGNSGHHNKPLNVSTIVATKFKSQYINVSNFSFPKGLPGTGGGAVGMHIPEFNLFLLGFHIASNEKHIESQIKELDEFFEKIEHTYSNIVFAGDFNRSYDYYKKHSNFANKMKFVVSNGRTFPSFFPIYKPFSYFSKSIICDQIDNIFFKGNMKILDSRIFKRRSDHKPLLAELEIKN